MRGAILGSDAEGIPALNLTPAQVELHRLHTYYTPTYLPSTTSPPPRWSYTYYTPTILLLYTYLPTYLPSTHNTLLTDASIHCTRPTHPTHCAHVTTLAYYTCRWSTTILTYLPQVEQLSAEHDDVTDMHMHMCMHMHVYM